jgi:hypothetical protein
MDTRLSNLGTGQAGTYAVSTLGNSSWLLAPTNLTGKKTRKSKAIKEVIHPIFAQCTALTEDPYWKDVFNNATFGKMPKCFSYKEGVLTYKRTTRIVNMDLPQVPYEALTAAMEFFRKHRGMASELDQEMARQNQYYIDMQEAQAKRTWRDIRKKMRESLIDAFINDQKLRFGLNKEEQKNLVHTIKYGQLSGYFHSDSFMLQNDRISQITGLLYNPETRLFSVDMTMRPRAIRSYAKDKGNEEFEKDTVPRFGKLWFKFMDQLDRKAARAPRVITITGATHVFDVVDDQPGQAELSVNSSTDARTDESFHSANSRTVRSSSELFRPMAPLVFSVVESTT